MSGTPSVVCTIPSASGRSNNHPGSIRCYPSAVRPATSCKHGSTVTVHDSSRNVRGPDREGGQKLTLLNYTIPTPSLKSGISCSSYEYQLLTYSDCIGIESLNNGNHDILLITWWDGFSVVRNLTGIQQNELPGAETRKIGRNIGPSSGDWKASNDHRRMIKASLVHLVEIYTNKTEESGIRFCSVVCPAYESKMIKLVTCPSASRMNDSSSLDESATIIPRPNSRSVEYSTHSGLGLTIF